MSTPEGKTAETTRETGRTSFPIGALAIVQTILFLGHWLLYLTAKSFWNPSASAMQALGIILLVLSLSFTITSLLSFRFSNPLVSLLYKVSSVWMGALNFLFWAACLTWAVDLVFRLALPASYIAARAWYADGMFAVAGVVVVYGFINARILRERRVTVSLPNLPHAWVGRKALLLSDLHLGHVNGAGFAGRIAQLANRLDPAIIFIAGDLFDGTRVNPDRLAAPLFDMKAPLGTWFCEGNHEDFGDPAAYCAALRRGGMRVLRCEHEEVEGVRIIGVPYSDSTYPMRFRSFLESLELSPSTPSILLNHMPGRLPLVEKAGVSLQLSGHTHGGQIFPFTWFTRRAFGKFTYGLQKFGNLQVLTSSGVGTWGPPMRVGADPEVVLITFGRE
ncbi:MAG TPA: metallophosphoesterase [Terracidiphilus sp.]